MVSDGQTPKARRSARGRALVLYLLPAGAIEFIKHEGAGPLRVEDRTGGGQQEVMFSGPADSPQQYAIPRDTTRPDLLQRNLRAGPRR